MGNGLRWFIPETLRYKLFVSFVLLLLLPVGALNLYNFNTMEVLTQRKVSEQSHEQLEQIKRTLTDLMSVAFKTKVLLEQDSSVEKIMTHPEQRSVLDNKYEIEEKFIRINNSFFLYNPSVYFTLVDLRGNVYTSYPPREVLDYDRVVSEPGFRQLIGGDQAYIWVPNDENYLSRDLSNSPSLISLYVTLRGEQSYEPFGAARISIDYSYWFKDVMRNSPAGQDYYIMTGTGDEVARSDPEFSLQPSVVREILSNPEIPYMIDDDTQSIINFSYIDSLDWFLINRVPLDILFDDIHRLKNRFFVTSLVFAAAFIAFIFLIASRMTRPLVHLQKKMKEAVRKNQFTRLPEENHKGEILQLTKTFNTMLEDTDELIQRLKREERQKEAVHFQMLLAQINPHFLLNTLNTIKWIAIKQKNEDIAEISVALGRLLETSLNSEIDLIYLKEELELVQACVFIHQARYRRQFKVVYEIDPGLTYALIPKLSLQPLVDNAIRHGFSGAAAARKGVIQVRVRAAEPGGGQRMLVAEVEDNGVGLDGSAEQADRHRRPGIGLSNLRERLKLLYKEENALEMISLEQGTLIRFRIPLLLSTPHAEGGSQDVDRVDRGG